MIQVLSFIHLGLFSVWFRRGTNWIEIGLIVLILFWAVVLSQGVMALDTFRTTAALTTFFFWLTFLNFLRGLLVEFAVFVSGVLHVVQRLGPFLLALVIILFAFMVRQNLIIIRQLDIQIPPFNTNFSSSSKFSTQSFWRQDIAMDTTRKIPLLIHAIQKVAKHIDSAPIGEHFSPCIRCFLAK